MEDAMKVAYFRGLCASKILDLPDVHGAMIAVGTSPEGIEPYIAGLVSGKVDVACINSPSSVTISGDTDAILELADKLRNDSVFYRRLAVGVAYHSHHMELVAEEYLNAIMNITPRTQDIITEDTYRPYPASMFSSVTGKNIRPEELDSQYWITNLLGRVNFSDSLKALCLETNNWHRQPGLFKKRREKRIGPAQKASVDCLLEIGPHSALSGPIRQILQSNVKLGSAEISYISILSRGQNSVESAMGAASTIASMNYPLDLSAVNFAKLTSAQRRPRLLVDMPLYKWNHTKSYWAEPRMSKTYRNRETPRTDLLGAPDNIACHFEPRWRNYIKVSEIPWIVDHKIQSDVVFPAAGYFCMIVEAVTQTTGNLHKISGVTFRNVFIHSALIITGAIGIEVLTTLRIFEETLMHDSEKWYKFHIYSVSKDNRWSEHCSGDIGVQIESDTEDVTIHHLEDTSKSSVGSIPQGTRVVDVGQLYERLQQVGLEYGPCFANLTSAHATKNGTCFAEVTIPDTAKVMPMNFQWPLLIHPCTLDSIFHSIFAALPDDMALEKGPIIPVSLEYLHLSYQLSSRPGEKLGVCTDVRPGLKGQIVASIIVTDNNTEVCSLNPKISINGLRGTRLETTSKKQETSQYVPLAYGIEWRADPIFLSEGDFSTLKGQDVYREPPMARSVYDRQVSILIQNALTAFTKEHIQKPDLIYDKYRTSLAEMIRMHTNDPKKPLDEISVMSEKPSSPMGRLINTIDIFLSSLSQIEEEPFAHIHENLSNAYHEVITADETYNTASGYLKILAFQKPDISILQLGDGSGCPLKIFIEALLADLNDEEGGFSPFATFTIWCEDEDEYERARANLQKWAKWINFMKVEQKKYLRDRHTSEIDRYFYDVIIAPYGLHYFSSKEEGLSICRSMLNRSGHLIIIDPLHPRESILDNFLTTALFSWPTGNFDQPKGLRDNAGNLDTVFHRSGLVQSNVSASKEKGDQIGDLIICQPQKDIKYLGRELLIIQGNQSKNSLAESLRSCLWDLSPRVELSNIAAANTKSKFCIVINEMHNNLLANPDPETFSKLKDIFLSSAGVLWISKCSTLDWALPERGLDVGFARTARSESAVKPIITLDLDAENPLPDQQVR